MKIGILVPGFSTSEQDWCIPALLDFVRVLSERAEVHVFTLRWPEHGRAYSVYGATVHAFNGREHLGLRAFRLYAQALGAIAGEHRRKPFTSLHAFWADEPGWVAALAGRWLGIPTIISLAGGELVRMPEIRYGMALRPGRRALIRWGLDRAQCIGVGSDYLMRIARSELGPRNQSKLKHIPLGVDTQLFSPQAPGHRPSSSPPKVLNVGSLTFVKGQRDL